MQHILEELEKRRAQARAGGGPENVLVVVNGMSWVSRTIANHYVQVRHIPPENVVDIDWKGDWHSTPVATFREQILRPVFEAMERRKLTSQIDYIVYSSDFPWQIDVLADLHGQLAPPQLSPVASLTGATYLAELALAGSPEIVTLQTNQYLRDLGPRHTAIPTHGFRSWYGWGPGGELLESGGRRYFLSAMLAVTTGRGNSIKEAVNYLDRAGSADGTAPKGSIYYHSTSDVRSTTRQWGFERAVESLAKLGVRAEVVSTAIPVGKPDVMGTTMGVNFFNWPTGKSQIRPGAFCDNLTSTAGMLARKWPRISSRLPGLAVMMARTWIIGRLRFEHALEGKCYARSFRCAMAPSSAYWAAEGHYALGCF